MLGIGVSKPQALIKGQLLRAARLHRCMPLLLGLSGGARLTGQRLNLGQGRAGCLNGLHCRRREQGVCCDRVIGDGIDLGFNRGCRRLLGIITCRGRS